MQACQGLLSGILAKLHIWNCRKRRVPPNLEIFKAMLDVKYRTEMYLASKNNNVKQLQAKWQFYMLEILFRYKYIV